MRVYNYNDTNDDERERHAIILIIALNDKFLSK